MVVLLMGGIYAIMIYTIEMAACGVMYLPSYMKIGVCIQAILSFC
jgi:hypothetical protein